MAEITLDTLRKQRGQAADVPAEETPDTLKEQITLLTPDERRKVEELKEQIDLTDSQMLMQYGAGAKQNIADFSENILDNVRAKDTGYVGELMTGLIANVEGLDFDSLEKEGGIMGIFKKAESKVKKFLMQYEKLEVQVDRIEGKLEEARMEMLKDIGMLDAMYEKKLHFKPELDVRGMRVDEALTAVTYFIDDAIQLEYPQVRILHGTGTGALREAIRQYLATVPGVARYHDEHVQFGGAGITVAELA